MGVISLQNARGNIKYIYRINEKRKIIFDKNVANIIELYIIKK